MSDATAALRSSTDEESYFELRVCTCEAAVCQSSFYRGVSTSMRSPTLDLLLPLCSVLFYLLCLSSRVACVVVTPCPASECQCFTVVNETAVDVTCAQRHLTMLPAFSDNVEIRLLNLSRNALSDQLSFRNIRVQLLDLAFNELTFVDKQQLSPLGKSLTHLYLGHNLISKLSEEAFDDLVGLSHLDLSHNELSEVSLELFSRATSLNHLDLRNNRLTSLGSSGSSSSVRQLDISDNRELDIQPATMSEFIHLDSLNMASVGLDNPETVFRFLSLETFPQLEMLNLSGNSLTFLNSSHLYTLYNKVTVLDLSTNPFHCNCSVISMVQWLHSNATVMKRVMRDWVLPVCQTPEALQGISVSSLTLTNLKYSCELMTQCNVAKPVKSDCMNVSMYEGSTTTAKATKNFSHDVYDSILRPYDPLMGWYTAAALGGMVLALIICLLFEKGKRKFEENRRRRWRRKCRQIWLESQAAALKEDEEAEAGALEDGDRCPQTHDCDIEINIPNKVKDNDCSSTEVAIQRHPPRRLSVSWGPTSDLSDNTPPNSPSPLTPNSQTCALRLSTIADNSSDKNSDSESDIVLPAITLPLAAKNTNCSREPQPSPALLMLDRMSQEMLVAEVHPDCPIHNPDKAHRLRTALRQHPDKTLQSILTEEHLG